MSYEILGVDIGGSHITAALVDLRSGLLIENSLQRNVVDAQWDKLEIISVWCKVITNAIGYKRTSDSKIGIAMPGPFDYENGISLIKDQDKFKSLYGVDIKKELANHLKINPNNIKFINDAAGFLQGEIFSGAAKGYQNVIGITLGTGLGSSVAVNGTAMDAALWNSKFKDGIAEDYFSTSWFIKRYHELSGKKISGVKELTELADGGNVIAIFKEFGENLASFLSPVIKKNETDMVILGGNIAKAYHLFQSSLTKKLAETCHVKVKLSELNEHAALIGAASCWNLVAL